MVDSLLPLHQVKGGSQSTPMLTALLEGPPGAGKTAVAATVAAESGFPFSRVLCAADDMVLPLPLPSHAALAPTLLCLPLGNLIPGSLIVLQI